MSETTTFHQQFGEPSTGARNKIKNFLEPWIQDFIAHAPFAILATANAQGKCDASPRGGKPGFVKVLNEHQLLLPDIKGNKLFQSYQNMAENPHATLIFFIPGNNEMVRVNGRVEILDKAQLEANQVVLDVFSPDENATILQGLLFTVEESYSHCPRAMAFSNIWSAETIQQNLANPPIERWSPAKG